jgi:IS30 family transposase
MRGYRHLTRRQRYIIEELLELEKSDSFIARELSVHRSTISREVRRNSSRHRGYHARGARASATGRKTHAVEYQQKICGVVEEIVTEKLRLRWSPEQISGRLRLENKTSVSHETIYRYILMDRRCGGVRPWGAGSCPRRTQLRKLSHDRRS